MTDVIPAMINVTVIMRATILFPLCRKMVVWTLENSHRREAWRVVATLVCMVDPCAWRHHAAFSEDRYGIMELMGACIIGTEPPHVYERGPCLIQSTDHKVHLSTSVLRTYIDHSKPPQGTELPRDLQSLKVSPEFAKLFNKMAAARSCTTTCE